MLKKKEKSDFELIGSVITVELGQTRIDIFCIVERIRR